MVVHLTRVGCQVSLLDVQQQRCVFYACCPEHLFEVSLERSSVKQPAGQNSKWR
jgi:hypothetical protein